MDDDADDARTHDRTRDALLVSRLRAGDERAFGEIYDLWYDRVHDLARRIVRDEGRAADVAQDTFLSAWRRIDTLADPASLGGWLLRIARNRALNVGQKEARSVAVDDESMHRIEAGGPTVNAPDGFRVADLAHLGDPARVVEHDEVAALLWEAADALGERDRTVLDLQLRHGLTPAEIGEVVGVNRNAANQLVHRVKGRLESAVQARVLWRGARPACETLRAALAAAGVDTFDSRAVTITNNHASSCEECGERQERRLQPAALFGALPIVVAPFALKQQAAAALAAEGVPMHGSTAATGTPGGSTWPGVGPTQQPTEAPTDGGGGEPRAGHRRTAVAVAVVLALFVLAAGIGLTLGGDDDAEGEEVRSGPTLDTEDDLASAPSTTEPEVTSTTAADATTTTTGPTTTTTSSTTTPTPTSPANGGPGGGDPPLVVPPTGPGTPPPAPTPTTPTPPAPTTTTTPAPTATASISVSPSSMPGGTPYNSTFGTRPQLQWSTSGGATVEVFGPGFTSTATDSVGQAVCPNPITPMWSTCVPPAGTYLYRVQVRSAADVVIASDSAYLTIT